MRARRDARQGDPEGTDCFRARATSRRRPRTGGRPGRPRRRSTRSRSTISSMQKRSWTRSWPARPSVSASGWSVSSRTIAAASAVGVVRRHEQAGHAVLDHLGDPADVRRDDRPRQRHRLEDRQALRLAVGRQDGDVERGGHRRHVVAAAGEHDPMGDPQLARLRLERVAPAALADDQQIGVRAPRAGPAATPRAASGGPSPARAARRRRRSASRAPSVLLGQRAARLLVVVALRGRRRCRSGGPARRSRPSSTILRSIDLRDRDQLVHLRASARAGASRSSSERTRLEWTVETTYGRAMAGLAERDRRPRPDDLGAVHVGVDDVRPDVARGGRPARRRRSRRRARR